MMNTNDTGTEAGSAEMLDLARRNVARLLRELDAVLSGLESGQDGAALAAKTVAVDLRKAIQTVFDERVRLEKLYETEWLGTEGGGLDLDAARDEVGRRLTCLRR